MSGPYTTKPNLRNMMARVRGLGSAHDGTHHFWMQRLTSIALVPLTLWFVIGVLCHIGAPYMEFVAWLSSVPVATTMILVITVSFYHAALGLQVVIEDYVHAPALKYTSLIIMKLGCVALGLMGVVSVLKILLVP